MLRAGFPLCGRDQPLCSTSPRCIPAIRPSRTVRACLPTLNRAQQVACSCSRTGVDAAFGGGGNAPHSDELVPGQSVEPVASTKQSEASGLQDQSSNSSSNRRSGSSDINTDGGGNSSSGSGNNEDGPQHSTVLRPDQGVRHAGRSVDTNLPHDSKELSTLVKRATPEAGPAQVQAPAQVTNPSTASNKPLARLAGVLRNIGKNQDNSTPPGRPARRLGGMLGAQMLQRPVPASSPAPLAPPPPAAAPPADHEQAATPAAPLAPTVSGAPQDSTPAAGTAMSLTSAGRSTRLTERAQLRLVERPRLLDPAGGSTSDGGTPAPAHGATLLHPESGQPLLAGIDLPLVGPLVISNSLRIWPDTDAFIDFEVDGWERLAARLEWVEERGDEQVELLLLQNISRIVRRRRKMATLFVNGQPLLVGERARPLSLGDVVTFGVQGPELVILEHAPAALPEGTVSEARQGRQRQGKQQQQQQQQPSLPLAVVVALREACVGVPTDLADSFTEEQLNVRRLSALARTDAARAAAGFELLVTQEPGNPDAWLGWAQLETRAQKPHRARQLFRAAVAAARLGDLTLPPFRSDAPASSLRSRLLLTALYSWAQFEWRNRLYGSARHLYRAAANEAKQHPQGPVAGGVAYVLHAWGNAELGAGNVANARIIVAEALRRCPEDAALYVLAGGVERQGGNLELARAFCMRAYQMDPRDKELYKVWPRIEAELDEPDKARRIFERGLSLHPYNTKLMKMFADLEAQEGNYAAAEELHRRALTLDPGERSETTMHNRVSWATMLAFRGELAEARRVLDAGLARHPRFLPGLLALVRILRVGGELLAAWDLLQQAAKLTHNFEPTLLKERMRLLRLAGEEALANNLQRHIHAWDTHYIAQKNAGAWGSEAWRNFFAATSDPARMAIVRKASMRKQQLGWLRRTPGSPTNEQQQAEQHFRAQLQAAGQVVRASNPAAALRLQSKRYVETRLQLRERQARQREASAAAAAAAEAAAAMAPPPVNEGDDGAEQSGPVGMPEPQPAPLRSLAADYEALLDAELAQVADEMEEGEQEDDGAEAEGEEGEGKDGGRAGNGQLTMRPQPSSTAPALSSQRRAAAAMELESEEDDAPYSPPPLRSRSLDGDEQPRRRLWHTSNAAPNSTRLPPSGADDTAQQPQQQTDSDEEGEKMTSGGVPLLSRHCNK